ncbi:hypothetical protein MANES_09G089922v8 [Manihot esculenta]|uniref:Uncharacterized protein n=1 Tax=Manihot esculenta TaxID=3983 RepID=A0ACB7H4X9_MANES|nr:hypothetical protein MANES_09G089922v8 [Manihot esculenta]
MYQIFDFCFFSILQQPSHHHQLGATGGLNSHQLPPLPPSQPHGSGGAGSIRPGSMADQARCESTNTKFCYFNNYSLSQPRHFCKTCRRYWTRGGALRNLPIGGGCRRDKRTKGSSSNSPATGDRQMGSVSSSTLPSKSGISDILGLGPQVPSLMFMAPLHHLTEFSTGDIGLNYGSLSASAEGPSDLNFQAFVSAGITGGDGSLLSAGGCHIYDPCKIQKNQTQQIMSKQ